MEKYRCIPNITFENSESEQGFVIIHTEDNISEIIATTDNAEKAHFVAKACNQFTDNDEESFQEAVKTWMQWTVENFPKSGAKSSLIHLQEEIKEIIEAIDDPASYTHNEGVILMEYADAFLCILTSAGKSGFTIDQLLSATKNKMKINYKREWTENLDGTYSHVK